MAIGFVLCTRQLFSGEELGAVFWTWERIRKSELVITGSYGAPEGFFVDWHLRCMIFTHTITISLGHSTTTLL